MASNVQNRMQAANQQFGAAPFQYDPRDAIQVMEYTITNSEAMYSCTSCGVIAVLCVGWGFISNEFVEDVSQNGEQSVWIVLLTIASLGSVWSILVVEPVTGIMQDDVKMINGRLIAIGPLGGQARATCFSCWLIAMIAASFGIISNRWRGEITVGTERAIWIILAGFWFLLTLGISGIVLSRLATVDGTGGGVANSDWRLREIDETAHRSAVGIDSNWRTFGGPDPDGAQARGGGTPRGGGGSGRMDDGMGGTMGNQYGDFTGGDGGGFDDGDADGGFAQPAGGGMERQDSYDQESPYDDQQGGYDSQGEQREGEFAGTAPM
jgi:hypothetical protein